MKTTTKSQTPKSEKIRKVRKSSSMEIADSTDEIDTFDDASSNGVTQLSSGSGSKIGLVLLFIIVLAGLIGYRYKYVLTPAVVNGQPIYVWDYLWKLHTQYGQDEINSMTTEAMIKQAVSTAKVTVSKTDIDKEVSTVEQQASSSGGLQAVLSAQHLTLEEFRTRIELQLAVKKILADKIAVSTQEVEDTYKKNKDFYKGLSEDEAKKEVKSQLEDQKFQTEVSKWLSDVRSKAKVDIKFPGLQSPPLSQ